MAACFQFQGTFSIGVDLNCFHNFTIGERTKQDNRIVLSLLIVIGLSYQYGH